ncbi:MAG: 2-succinyl-5-enolpyruvyl-6-hydroxy-3-cyclohexene-1-carboxylic-acid synthase [Polyangiaceae bacterium]|nr:2-succinyl-5-enolpyruvyl-6-hydroxy-3-cyclohexene-1-carboxylic-acid synthase [Polyangiaceae bacterium]
MSRDQFAWIETFMETLAFAGVRDVVVCPGSRSTPLALAADTTEGFVRHVAVDERAAAFFALGQARVKGRPSAVLCTSGTAGAHFLPAIIEASQSHIPLLVLTADRPWDLVGVAAPQTTDQHALFGVHVRAFLELGLHEASLKDGVAARVAAQAVSGTLSPTPGPVHVNVRLRKPLEPTKPWPHSATRFGANVARGKTRVFMPKVAPSPEAIDTLVEHASRARRGLIVCGPAKLDRPNEPLRDAAVALARATGFVLLAETTSQARFGKTDPNVVECPAFDAILRDPPLCKALETDLILELGAPPTSSNYAAYVEQHAAAPRFVIAAHGWNDPAQDATALVLADPAEVCRAVTDRLLSHTVAPDPRWASAFRRANALVWSFAEKHAGGPSLTEALVARTVVSRCPEGALLAVGNSLPVRDVDLWAPARQTRLDVLHQRGVSGIDGLVAGASGAASVANRPVVLLLGDTSMLHDLSSLVLARHVPGPLVIVVVQNQGGRIFERLPVVHAVDRERFDKYFTMHEAVDLGHAAAAFGIGFVQTDNHETFVQSFDEALRKPGATLIEAVVPPEDGTARAARFRAEVAERLRFLCEEVSR